MIERIFRAYDVRGVYRKELNEEIAEKIGYATAIVAESEELVVGRDTRYHSPSLTQALIKGINDAGCDVIFVGANPNPLVYYACWSKHKPGIYATASHNPPEYGGFKFIRRDGTSFIEEYRKIKEIVLSEKFEKFKKLGSVKEESILESYLETVGRYIRVEGKVKIVAETFGGAVNLVLPKILNAFNIEFEILHPEIRGDFYGLRPEPKGENLQQLRQKAVEKGADFGVAFDGDADRAVFVDDKGRELSGSLAGIVFTKYLTKEGDTIVLTYDTSTALKEVAENKGLNIVWSRVGHGFIEEKVRDHKAVLGIEQSSHFYFGFLYPFSDGVLSTLLMASIVSQEVKISEVLEKIKARPMEKIYINAVNDHIKKKVIKKIEEMYPSAEKLEDGVKIYIGDEWVIVRESQTMPEVNLVVEARDEKRLKELVDEYSKLIGKLVKEASI